MAVLGINDLESRVSTVQGTAIRKVIDLLRQVFPNTPYNGYYWQLTYYDRPKRAMLAFYLTPNIPATLVFGETAALAQVHTGRSPGHPGEIRDTLYYDEWSDFIGWASATRTDHPVNELDDTRWVHRIRANRDFPIRQNPQEITLFSEGTILEMREDPFGEILLRVASNNPRLPPDPQDPSWVVPEDWGLNHDDSLSLAMTETEPEGIRVPHVVRVDRPLRLPPDVRGEGHQIGPGQVIEIHPSLTAFRLWGPDHNKPEGWSLQHHSWHRYPGIRSELRMGTGGLTPVAGG